MDHMLSNASNKADKKNVLRSLAFSWGILSFFPNPAVNIGPSTGIQIGNLFAIVVVLLYHAIIPAKHKLITFVYILSVLISLLGSGLFSDSMLVNDYGIKNACLTPMMLSSLLVTGILIQYYPSALINGIISAILVHSVVGMHQAYSFSLGIFPMLSLYNNNSFGINQEIATALALYVKRPFGLFPEPSAMSASIGPWLLFILSDLIGVTNFTSEASGLIKWFRIITFTLGTILLVQSLSVFVVFFSAAALIVILMRVQKSLLARTSKIKTLLIIITGFLFSSIVLYFYYDRISYRIFSGDPWISRADSIMNGLNLLMSGGLTVLLFGIGIGQAPEIIRYSSGYDAIWSILFTNLVEGGLFSFLLWATIIYICLNSIWKAKDYNKWVGYIFFVLWLIAISVTTSYSSLAPIWVSLGCLLSWNAISEGERQYAQ